MSQIPSGSRALLSAGTDGHQLQMHGKAQSQPGKSIHIPESTLMYAIGLSFPKATMGRG